MRRTKVIAKPPGRWRPAILFAVGFLAVAANWAALPWLGYAEAVPESTTRYYSLGRAVSLLLLLPLLLVGLAFSEQRGGRAVLEGLALGLGVSTAACLWLGLSENRDWMSGVMVAVLLPIFYLCVRLIGTGLVRHYLVTIVIQEDYPHEWSACDLPRRSPMCPVERMTADSDDLEHLSSRDDAAKADGGS